MADLIAFCAGWCIAEFHRIAAKRDDFVALKLPRETHWYAQTSHCEDLEAFKIAAAGKRYDVADAIIPGFGVGVNDRGRKSFTLAARYPGSSNPTRRTIAEVGAMDLAMAREIARAWLVQINAGIDPRVELDCLLRVTIR